MPTIDPKFKVNQTVRWLHDFDPDEVDCDVGVIFESKCKFQDTPLERVLHTVRFSRGVFKVPMYQQVYELSVSEDKLVSV